MDQTALVDQDQYTDYGETCESQIASIKKNVAELIKYQHEIIKEQSAQLLSLVDIVNHSTKNLTDAKQEIQRYSSSSGGSAFPLRNILFILVIMCIVSFLIYKKYMHR